MRKRQKEKRNKNDYENEQEINRARGEEEVTIFMTVEYSFTPL